MNIFTPLRRTKSKRWLTLLALLLLSPFGFAQTGSQPTREQFEVFLNNHPYMTRPYLSKKDRKAIPKRDRPNLAMEQDFLRTLDPALGTVPYERKIAALEHSAQRRQLLAAIPGVTWTERGPNNVAGRTRALMYDPNDAANGYKKVWAGGVGGGLWYNNDITSATSQWVHVDNFWDNIAISCIAYDPSNTQVFYVGTGEGWFNVDAQRGAGIWKTANGGATWTRLTSTTTGTNFRTVQKIAVKANGSVFAATNAGLFRSTDGGNNWTNVLGTAAADIEVAANGDLFVANNYATGPGKIHKSTNADNGTTWTQLGGGLPATGIYRIELATAPSNANVVYAVIEGSANGVNSGGGIFKTTDGGTTWTATSLPTDADTGIGNEFTRGQAWYDLIAIVDPNNANTLYVGGIDIFRSTNAGTSWTQLCHWYGGFGFQEVHADQHSMAFKPGSSTDLLFGNDGGVYLSSNATAASPTLSARNSGYNVTQFYSCAIHPTAGSNHMLAGAQDNGTQRYSAAGMNSTFEVIGGDGAFCFIDEDQPNIQIGSYTNNNYYVSTNGGTSFTALGTNNTGSFINPCDYDSRTNILFSATSSTAIRRVSNVGTTNTAGTFNAAIGAMPTAIKVSPYAAVNTSTIFVGTGSGRLFKITNAHGATPTTTEITNGLPTGSISCIELGGSENRILVTYSNYGVVSVWESTNGGTTWVNKEDNLPDMPIRWALYNPSNLNQVMLGTEVGVWSTTTISGTPGWAPSVNGMANTRIDMMKYRASDKLVVVGTHGRGLFTTDVFSTPTAEFTASPLVTYIGKNVQFTDGSLAATSWSWNFGDGNTSTVRNPVHAYAAAGFYNITLSINGGVSTRVRTAYIQVLPDRPTPYLIAQGGNFETNTGDFGALNITGTPFERGNSAIAGKNGVVSGSNAWVTGLTASNYSNNTETYVYTPNYNMAATGTYNLSFQTKFSTESEWDGFTVEYSTDKGSNWTRLGNSTSATWYNAIADVDNDIFPPGGPFFSGTNNAYNPKDFNISFLGGNANVAFRFKFKSDGIVTDVGAAIDDFQITLVDNAAPLIVTLSPANNSVNVAANTNLVMTFNEAIQKGTGNIIIKENGVVTQTIPVTNANVTVAGTTVTIDPATDFTAGAVVNVEMAAGVFKDLSNNNFAGFSLATDWRFTIISVVNQPPVFTKGADQTVNEDAGLQTVANWATNIDDGNPTLVQALTFTLVNSNPALFSVQPAIDPTTGTLTYTPAANANGTASLTVRLSDNGSNVAPNSNTSAPQDFNITVNPVNDAPLFTKGADQTVLDIAGAQTVNNWATAIADGDPELTQTWSFTVTNTSNASFTVQPAIDANGNLTYTPAVGASGVVTVSVLLTDNGSGVAPNVNTSAVQTFTITINPGNQPPVFTKGADQTVDEDAGAQTATNWATGIDDGNPTLTQNLTFTVVNSNPALFSVQPAINATGTLTYTPAANANGTASLTVRLSDDGLSTAPHNNTSAPQDFNITVNPVNDAPSFVKGADQAVPMNSPAQTVANWATGIIDGDPELTQNLTFILNNNNNALFTVQPAVDASGELTYTPAPGMFGTALVGIRLRDDGSGVAPNVNLSPIQTFLITITSNFNNPPAFTAGSDQTVNEDAAAQTVNGWATNIDDGDPTLTQTVSFIVVNSNPALFAVQPAISPTGVLTYTPAANANGTASLTVRLQDSGSGVFPNQNTSMPQDFNITVNPVNDAPVFTAGSNLTVFDTDGPQVINNWATGMNDGDPELTQTLTFNVTNSNNALFAVQPAISSTGTLTYTPVIGASGVVTVTVVLQDNGSGVAPNVNVSTTQTFTITINVVNQPPVFVRGLDQIVDEDAAAQSVANWATAIDDGNATLTQNLNFTIVNSNPALFSVQPAVSATGTLSYTPAANANGTASLTVRLVDDGLNTAPHRNNSLPQDFNITVNPVNDAPVFTAGSNLTVFDNAGAIAVNGWAGAMADGDPELTQSLSFTVTNNTNASFTAQPAIDANGNLTFTPAIGASGVVMVSVTLVDNGSGIAPNVNTSTVQTFTITINTVNHPPVFTKGGDQTADEDAAAQSVANWATGIDDGNPTLTQNLTFTVVNSNPALFSVQPAVNANGTLTYTPAANANGTASLTVRLADDGSNTSPHRNTSLNQDFNITVNPINDAPVFTLGANITAINTIGHTSANWSTGIGDGDPELTQVLTFTVTNNNNALFTVQPAIDPANGTLTFTPVFGALGTVTVTVVLTDNGSGVAPNVNTSVTKTFTITLINCNNSSINATITNLQNRYCRTTGAFTLTATPAGGVFKVDGVVAAQFNPSAATLGNHTIEYTYTDANNCSDTDTRVVSVEDVPAVAITGLNNAYCVNDPVLTLAGTPTGGVFKVNGVTSTVFDPATLGAGTHTVTYTYQDNTTQCSNTAAKTVTINALPVISINQLQAVYCVKDADVTLQGSPAGGTFKVSGTTKTTFSPSTLGVGTYTVEYSYTEPGTGCKAVVTQTVDVLPVPTVNLGSDKEVCSAVGSVRLVPVSGSSSASLTYLWSTGATTSDITVSQSGTYSVTATETTTGCSSSDTIKVFFNQTPVFSFKGVVAGMACQARDTITIETTNVLNMEIKWTGPGIVSTSTDKLTIIVDKSGVYSATLTDKNRPTNCTATQSVTVNLGEFPVVKLATKKYDICQDSVLTVNGTATNHLSTFQYRWRELRTGSVIATAPKLTVSYAAMKPTPVFDPVRYELTVTSNTGCIVKDTMEVTFREKAIVKIDKIYKSRICLGESVTLKASGGTIYKWSGGGLTATTATVTVKPDKTGLHTYIVELASGNSCKPSYDTAMITVAPALRVTIANDTLKSCEDAPVTASALHISHDAETVYSWRDLRNNNILATTAGVTFKFADIKPQPTYSPIGYEVTATNPSTGCSAKDTVHVIFMRKSKAAIQLFSGKVCIGDSVKLTASGGTSYAWSTGKTGNSITVRHDTTGIFRYILKAQFANTCGASYDTVDIEVVPRPVGKAHTSKEVTICPGDKLTLTASGGVRYLWTHRAQTAATVVAPVRDTWYSVRVFNEAGCWDLDSVLVKVTPRIDLQDKILACEGESVSIDATSPVAARYLWSDGDTTAVKKGITTSRKYTVRVTVKNCVYYDTTEVIFRPTPRLEIKKDALLCFAPLNERESGSRLHTHLIQGKLTNPVAGEVYYYEVKDSTGKVVDRDRLGSNNLVPVRAQKGMSRYVVNVRNSFGCASTDTIRIRVACSPRLKLPEAFTPNDDKLNDIFAPMTSDMEGIRIRIYQRWGNVVYEKTLTKEEGWNGSFDEKEGWDGTLNGKPAPVDAYSYVIEYWGKDETGAELKKSISGTIHLIRE